MRLKDSSVLFNITNKGNQQENKIVIYRKSLQGERAGEGKESGDKINRQVAAYRKKAAQERVLLE